MPSWGRPSGGRKGKNKKEWERQRKLWEEQQARFEELDTDSDDDNHGVDLDRSFESDSLQFTGADVGRTNNRQAYGYSDDSEEEEEDDDYEPSGGPMQVALRDKEEVLVQRALERIRRAQALGYKDVSLPPKERDALERKIASDQAKAKAKKPALSTKRSSEGRRTSSRLSITAPPTVAGKKKSKSALNKQDAPVTTNLPPGFVVPGPDGQMMYQPIGYSPPSSSSRPSSRPNSSQSLQNPQPQPQYRGQPRYLSGPDQFHPPASHSPPVRPLPDDPNWQPRPRSSSNLGYGYPVDQYGYPYASQPLPPGYVPGRRNVSGPTEVGYPNVRHSQVPPRGYASSSDPSLARRDYSGSSGRSRQDLSHEDDDDDYDDGHDGVQVDVVPYGQGGYDVVSTSKAQGSGSGRQRRVKR